MSYAAAGIPPPSNRPRYWAASTKCISPGPDNPSGRGPYDPTGIDRTMGLVGLRWFQLGFDPTPRYRVVHPSTTPTSLTDWTAGSGTGATTFTIPQAGYYTFDLVSAAYVYADNGYKTQVLNTDGTYTNVVPGNVDPATGQVTPDVAKPDGTNPFKYKRTAPYEGYFSLGIWACSGHSQYDPANPFLPSYDAAKAYYGLSAPSFIPTVGNGAGTYTFQSTQNQEGILAQNTIRVRPDCEFVRNGTEFAFPYGRQFANQVRHSGWFPQGVSVAFFCLFEEDLDSDVTARTSTARFFLAKERTNWAVRFEGAAGGTFQTTS